MKRKCFKDSRISYCFAEGRSFWKLIRNLSMSLDQLNRIYEFDEPPYFVFPDIEPLGYSRTRISTVNAISDLTDFWGLSGPNLITARYLSPSSRHSGFEYSKGALFLVRLNQSNLSRHIDNMDMLYNTTSPNYRPDQLYDVALVAVHGSPKNRLSFDIRELKRLLILLAAALALNGGSHSTAHGTPIEQSTITY